MSRLEWLIRVPEAMTKDTIKVYVNRLACQPPHRNHLEDKIRVLRRWVAWYRSTDFNGRYPTNQVIFVKEILPILESKLRSMGQKREYIKTKNYVNGKRKRQESKRGNVMGGTQL